MNRKIEQLISIPLWIFIAPNVLTHWDMVKGDGLVKKLKKASYSELKEKMLSVEWEFDPRYKYSLFDKNDFFKNSFHASIFQFDGVGYLLTPYGWIMANVLQRRLRKKCHNYQPSIKPYTN